MTKPCPAQEGTDNIATEGEEGTIMTEETIDQISDADVFKEAVADAPKVETEAPEKEQTEEVKTEDRTRDEKGRFVAKDKDEEGESPPVAEAALEEAPQEDTPKEERKQDHRIPLTELLNEREKRQNAERRAEAIEQRFLEAQRQIQAAQQKPEEPIDIFADPDAYRARVEQTIEQRFKAQEGNFSLRLAHYKHGDLFTEAWEAMADRTRSGDDSLRQQVIASSDPGETLVRLYQREKTLSEVGTDPVAYKSKVLEDALKDPQFLEKALQAARQSAGAQPKPNNKIDLPPSLNKVASAHSGADGDDSDSSIFSYAIGRR
jgi:hypothetical protein